MKLSVDFAGEICWRCEQPIIGLGVIADVPGEKGKGATSWHDDCYEQAWIEYTERLRAEIRGLVGELDVWVETHPYGKHKKG